MSDAENEPTEKPERATGGLLSRSESLKPVSLDSGCLIPLLGARRRSAWDLLRTLNGERRWSE